MTHTTTHSHTHKKTSFKDLESGDVFSYTESNHQDNKCIALCISNIDGGVMFYDIDDGDICRFSNWKGGGNRCRIHHTTPTYVFKELLVQNAQEHTLNLLRRAHSKLFKI